MIIRKIYYWLKIIRLSFRWVFNFNLGDKVIYQGKVWGLQQGVRAPVWRLCNKDECVEVHEKDFCKVRTLQNYIGSFKSGYRFYMGYWYSIWITEGIKPWMKGCNIWGKKTDTKEPTQ